MMAMASARTSGRRFQFEIAISTLLLLALTGCGRNEIQVYSVPKERRAGAAWQLPEGWQERPAGGMRAARFAVPGAGGREADVSVIPLRGITASRLDIVNLWREQVRLGPLTDQELRAAGEKAAIAGEPGDLFDMVSTEPMLEDGGKARILVAMAGRGTTTWFLKMTGEDELVRSQKTNYLRFLASVNLDEMPAPGTAEPRMTSTNVRETPRAPHPQWTVPPNWQEQPPSQMLLAKFLITGTEGRADVNVSVLGGAGGGLRENVNRWRQQLGLEPLDEAGINRLVTAIELPGGRASLVDMDGTDARTGQPARLIGAIVPREGETWFYKLMGSGPVAEREKASFIRFVQSVKYPNG
jgi:hypothetical protein